MIEQFKLIEKDESPKEKIKRFFWVVGGLLIFSSFVLVDFLGIKIDDNFAEIIIYGLLAIYFFIYIAVETNKDKSNYVIPEFFADYILLSYYQKNIICNQKIINKADIINFDFRTYSFRSFALGYKNKTTLTEIHLKTKQEVLKYCLDLGNMSAFKAILQKFEYPIIDNLPTDISKISLREKENKFYFKFGLLAILIWLIVLFVIVGGLVFIVF